MNELVILRDISKSYNDTKVLYDVNFTIKKGEIITVIGPNGSGKSTLARILMGLIKADSGSRIISKGTNISYMPQKIAINPQLPLTVMRFLTIALPKQENITKICQELEIESVLLRQMSEISGGEMQRVLFARCLLSSPDLLILDEPMQGVDLNGQIWFYQLLAKFRDERKISILIISHDLHMVMKATDKVLCLNHHICCFGTPDAISTDPAYLETFSKEAIATMAIYNHHHHHNHKHE